MITLGLINELLFIYRSYGPEWPIICKLDFASEVFQITIDGKIKIKYSGIDIWEEEFETFSIESLDCISRIAACLNNNHLDNSWKKTYPSPCEIP